MFEKNKIFLKSFIEEWKKDAIVLDLVFLNDFAYFKI